MTGALVAAGLPSGPAYTVVLVCHVAAVLVGLVAAVASAVAGARVLGAGAAPLSASVRRYFEPGVNWAGRVLYLVPVFGAALIAMSDGAYPLGAGWVLAGIGLWVAATAVAEAVLWPAERRVQRALSVPDASAVAPDARRACLAVCLAAATVVALVVAAMVVMVAKP
ncbi:MAG: hypothetical protein ACRDWE_00415 [Acidimicrobiales bacterium]